MEYNFVAFLILLKDSALVVHLPKAGGEMAKNYVGFIFVFNQLFKRKKIKTTKSKSHPKNLTLTSVLDGWVFLLSG